MWPLALLQRIAKDGYLNGQYRHMPVLYMRTIIRNTQAVHIIFAFLLRSFFSFLFLFFLCALSPNGWRDS